MRSRSPKRAFSRVQCSFESTGSSDSDSEPDSLSKSSSDGDYTSSSSSASTGDLIASARSELKVNLRPPVGLSATQRSHVSGWGRMMVSRARLTDFLAGLQLPLSLSDCSGPAGSWWALKELTNNRCLLSSHAETGHAALKFLLANSSARMIHGDMLRRDRSTLPRDTILYDCGFPCQPFSLLHSGSRLLGEPEAEVFREAMRTIFTVRPLICVLENVVGVLRVWETMEKYLRKHNDYFYGRLIIDPVKLGDSVRRRRVYILMVHKFLSGISFLTFCCGVKG